MRTHLFRKWRRQLIPPVLRSRLYLLYILQSFSRVRRKTSFLRHEWCEILAPQTVQEATHTSCFAMTFMSFVHFASLSLLRRPTSVLRDEWRENNFSESAGDNAYLLFYNDIDVSCTSCKFKFCRMHNLFQDHFYVLSSFFKFHPGTKLNEFSPFRVSGWVNFSKFAKHSWNRRFYENFAIESAFWKFTPCTTQDEVSPSWWDQNLIL